MGTLWGGGVADVGDGSEVQGGAGNTPLSGRSCDSAATAFLMNASCQLSNMLNFKSATCDAPKPRTDTIPFSYRYSITVGPTPDW